MQSNTPQFPKITIRPFGATDMEDEVLLYTLENASGMKVAITNFGGIVTECWVPDHEGNLADVVLGHSNVSQYQPNPAYLGAIIGRFGNRIGGAAFTLGGEKHVLLPTSEAGAPKLQLHGGPDGFDRRIWEAKPFILDGEAGLHLHLSSPDGDQGFPGKLEVTVTYLLTQDNALRIDYEATTDRATPVNLTNHCYFNLRGEGNGDILNHLAWIHADAITAIDETVVPDGTLMPLDKTPFDFREPIAIGSRIDTPHRQMQIAGGYDHNYVLAKPLRSLEKVAEVFEPLSGRVLEVISDMPGVQFYTGNSLDGSLVGKAGIPYIKRSGFCLETQFFPNCVNVPEFPSCILNPGEQFSSTTVYRFSSRI
jgi:aldose 1-epimerase